MSAPDCPACAGEPGASHTCPDSGTFLAAEAHVAGEVEEIAAPWPTWQATIQLRLKAPDEETGRAHLTRLMGELLDDALVSELDFGFQAHEVTA